MISVQKYFISKPPENVDFIETKLNLPLGFSMLKFSSIENSDLIEMYCLLSTDAALHPERAVVVRDGVDLEKIFGKDPWSHQETLVDTQEIEGTPVKVAYHVFVFMPTAERIQMQRQMAAFAQGQMGGGGGELILPR